MTAGVDIAALESWMSAEGLGAGPIEDAETLVGGTQNILLRFRRDGRTYVLRRPPLHPRSNSNETMRREARLLGSLAGSDVPHPALIAACGDEGVIGAAFYLMEPVEGFNPVSGLPAFHHDPAVQHRMGLALVEGIAALGAIDHVAAGLADFGKAEDYLARQVSRWRSQLNGYAAMAGWPGAETLGNVGALAAWLEANRPATFTPGIMHGDYHLANVMFRPDSPELAAIVDWELATIGDPLIDLGWLLATWPEPGGGSMVSVTPWNGFPTPEELVSHYAERSTRDVSAIGWYAIFACYKLAILLESTNARACAGQAPRETGNKLHNRARWLIARAGRWMDDGVLAAPAKGRAA